MWFSFLKTNGQRPWSDWNFSGVGEKGSVYTIFHNISTLNFLNKYAYQNFLQLIFLNFNWIYWLIFCLGVLIFIQSNKKNIFATLLKDKPKPKAILAIVVFSFSYFLTVLTFQTYTIPRYALPIIPFLLIGVSWSIQNIDKKWKIGGVYLITLGLPQLT